MMKLANKKTYRWHRGKRIKRPRRPHLVTPKWFPKADDPLTVYLSSSIFAAFLRSRIPIYLFLHTCFLYPNNKDTNIINPKKWKKNMHLSLFLWKDRHPPLYKTLVLKQLTRNNQLLFTVSHIPFSVRSIPISRCYIWLARLASLTLRTLKR